MKKLLHNHTLHIVLALTAIVAIIYMAIQVLTSQPVEYITTVVERGTVQQLVSVSGVIEAEQNADLAFPVGGIVVAVPAKKGAIVAAGEALVVLDARTLAADRQDAQASLSRAVATRNELLAGADPSTRIATAETIVLKQATVDTTIATQADLVANAKRTLLTSDLAAISEDPNEDATAPVISGTYQCDDEGVYEISVFASGANSGYSYRLSGLETGTFTASTEQPTALGTCGLRAIFAADSRYSNTTWLIEIPNKKSPFYISNRNAYTLAQTQASSAIALAKQDVVLAQANADTSNAPARSEAIDRANADITSANARINRIDSQIADRTLRAPFAGTVTDIDILPGETVTTAPVVTVLAAADFELTARIPEVDIGKLAVGQQATIAFDARANETFSGTVDFISLQATEIDGVAYYEAVITLAETPNWMRSGLNADIDIIISDVTDSLRVPKRFVTETDGVYTVRTKNDTLVSTTTIDVAFSGNDGYVAITGVNQGDILVAP